MLSSFKSLRRHSTRLLNKFCVFYLLLYPHKVAFLLLLTLLSGTWGLCPARTGDPIGQLLPPTTLLVTTIESGSWDLIRRPWFTVGNPEKAARRAEIAELRQGEERCGGRQPFCRG